MSKSVIEIIEEVCEIVCDELCKYRDSTDENCECDYIKKNGTCPLSKLYQAGEQNGQKRGQRKMERDSRKTVYW